MRRATKIATFSLKTMKHTELGDKIFEKIQAYRRKLLVY